MVAIRPRTRKRKRAQKTANAARARLDHVRGEIRELGRIGQPLIARERDGLTASLMENRRRLSQANAHGSEPALAPMELDRWVMWRPDPTAPMVELRVGSLREGSEGDSLGVPCVVPLLPGRSIVIVSNTDRQRESARSLWRALATRLAALNAGRAEMVLLDPAGTSFPAGHRLFSHVVQGTDISSQIDRWRIESAESGPRFVAACDVPSGFSHRDAALLLAMVRTAEAASLTMVLHVDQDAYRGSIGELDLGDETCRWLIDVGDTEFGDGDVGASVVWDEAPGQALVELIADRLASG